VSVNGVTVNRTVRLLERLVVSYLADDGATAGDLMSEAINTVARFRGELPRVAARRIATLAQLDNTGRASRPADDDEWWDRLFAETSRETSTETSSDLPGAAGAAE
jgi:hypothetical protein